MKLRSKLIDDLKPFRVHASPYTGEYLIKFDQLLKLFKEYGKRELIKIIDEYKCDFNWDFEKGKPKKKSLVNIWELRKKLKEI